MKLLITCLLFSSITHAQHTPLSVGDTLPQKHLQFIKTRTNSPLGDGGRGIIILDFFATWCTACIRSLPRLDSLQKQFGNRLQIIIVANESSQKIEAFRKRSTQLGNCTLPIITGDSIFKKLFPHISIPHEVWIDNNGIVKAITSDEEVNEANIRSMLAGKALQLPLKKDWIDFDHRLPIPQQNLLFRSLITARIEGIGGKEGMIYSDDSTTKRYFYINRPVRLLYKTLGITNNTDNRIFCYEITVPATTTKEQMKQWMLEDLNRFFKQ
jgi:thiol-disulfide isomerase/thioredoxin